MVIVGKSFLSPLAFRVTLFESQMITDINLERYRCFFLSRPFKLFHL